MLQSSKFKLIVGLGNPGKEYANTYHNVGYLTLDHIGRWLRITGKWDRPSGKKFTYLKDGELIMVKPLTFMNESGAAVRQALAYFKCELQEILIIHDDSDIALGKYKLVSGRGPAGHRGILSIIAALGTKNFARLRLGIRHTIKAGLPAGARQSSPPLGLRRAKAGDFVLRKIRPEDKRVLYSTIEGLTPKVIVNDTS
ncbi:MAG: aminoacyl-tRNA hydrolase [Patescibacteria group bacterium]